MIKSRFNNKKANVIFRAATLLLFLLLLLFPALLSGCSSRHHDIAQTSGPVTEYIRASELIDHTDSAAADVPDKPGLNPYPDLSVPTQLTKVEDTYFLVDCYHNQVIYHDNLDDPLYEWQIMTTDIAMGHTLASDGTVYLIDDTENNRILVMEEAINDNGCSVFVPTQEFTDIGNRPHYILYDDYTDTFYAWSSMTGEMFLFRHTFDDSRMYLTEVRAIPSLEGIYVRSFTIVEDRIYFVSGNASIIEADLYSFKILKEYPVPDALAGMVQLTPIGDEYYITVSTDHTGNQDYATMIRAKSLDDLASGKYEDVYHNFVGGGTPYYITRIDDFWYLTEHRIPGHSIWQFQVQDNEIKNVISIY